MRMLTSNFIAAMSLAIRKQEELEKARGFTGDMCSAFLAGLRAVRDAANNNEAVYIRDS